MLENSRHVPASDPRVRRTRHILQQAARELMTEREFVEISVRDITERAGFNRATFYKHFVDKYDLMGAYVRDGFQATLDKALPENPEISRATVQILIQTTYDYMSSFHGMCLKARTKEEHSLIMQVQQQVYENLLRWLKNQAGSAHKSPETVAMITGWAIFGPMLQTRGKLAPVSRQALINEITGLAYSILDDYLHPR